VRPSAETMFGPPPGFVTQRLDAERLAAFLEALEAAQARAAGVCHACGQPLPGTRSKKSLKAAKQPRDRATGRFKLR
jgi:hypothetical protein